MNVVEEKSLKDTRSVNIFFFFFMASVYQVLTAISLFWTDIIPGFGYADGIHQFGQKYGFRALNYGVHICIVQARQ